ncbi:MAG: ABC-type uncharacterized transport system involved in gliding motility auxiliary subunit [Planctomycetota bacterium]|jgi:ABC-type uncharacterized transport system involved in gliding motility auxiliary subunit
MIGMHSSRRPSELRRGRERGAALPLLLHVVLLLLVLGQIVYLASRYRVRIDMTTDKLWTTTASTSKLVGNLKERLIVEAYFSPKENLPLSMSSSRDWADNFLDEITQLGKGRVIVQRFDPNSDAAIAKTASRLGIQPLNLRSQSATSLSVDQHWQGLRLLYGGGKQKVIEAFLPRSSFQAEAMVTPKIKEVITGSKRRIGYMEWPARVPRGRQQKLVGWNMVRTQRDLKSRYEFQNYKDTDGALLPADLETLFLFRPMLLTDRQKYVVDQFVMSGGTLVIFADAAEYQIDAERSFKKVPFALDAKESAYPFVQQLSHYGVDWQPRLVADMHDLAYKAQFSGPQEYFARAMRVAADSANWIPVAYPYFLHAVNYDWAMSADQLAVDPTGKIDELKAAQYRKSLRPGMPADDFLFQGFKKAANRGPGFYWPTWVGLRERAGGVPDMPDGVEGRVLLWTSPLALVESPPAGLNPVGFNEGAMEAEHQRFMDQLRDRVLAEPRLQAPLMVEVQGEFQSFFVGKAVPKRPSQILEESRRAKDEAKPGDEPVEPSSDANGPQPAKLSDSVASNAEDPMRPASASPGRIIVVGDATFLRDDVIGGDYKGIGGPVSGGAAMPFFGQMLDWLSDDRDLVDLQSRVPADRTLALVDTTAKPNEDPRDAEQAMRSKTTSLVALNVIMPCLVLLTFGLIVWNIRRNQKRAFLTSLDTAEETR